MVKQNKKISDIAVQKPGNKINVQYLVGVFVVVIAIVGFGLIVNGEITGRAITPTENIIATSCNADDTCEVNNIDGKHIGVNDILTERVITNDIEVVDSIKIGNYIWEDIDYACIDKEGYIFRSDMPCN